MLRNIFSKLLIIGAAAIALSGCTSIIAPSPKMVSEWPFGDAKSVVLSADMGGGSGDAPSPTGDAIVINVKKGTPYNTYSTIDGEKEGEGRIWFKKSPADDKVYAYAFNVPMTKEEWATEPAKGEEDKRAFAIYARGELATAENKNFFLTYILTCPDEKKNKQFECNYDTEEQGWNAALTLAPDVKTDEDVIPFEIKK